jgi:hypothetical protein
MVDEESSTECSPRHDGICAHSFCRRSCSPDYYERCLTEVSLTLSPPATDSFASSLAEN